MGLPIGAWVAIASIATVLLGKFVEWVLGLLGWGVTRHLDRIESIETTIATASQQHGAELRMIREEHREAMRSFRVEFDMKLEKWRSDHSVRLQQLESDRVGKEDLNRIYNLVNETRKEITARIDALFKTGGQ